MFGQQLWNLANLDKLFLAMGFISLVNEIQFMLISSRHICIRFNGLVYLVYTNMYQWKWSSQLWSNLSIWKEKPEKKRGSTNWAMKPRRKQVKSEFNLYPLYEER